MGDSYIVDLHPIHLRYIAEKTGLVREVFASEADALRMVVKLKRRLLVLKARIDHLGQFLSCFSDSEHADLEYEQTYATATADICDEFCADLDDICSGPETLQVTTASVTPNAPESGVLEEPQKRGLRKQGRNRDR